MVDRNPHSHTVNCLSSSKLQFRFWMFICATESRSLSNWIFSRRVLQLETKGLSDTRKISIRYNQKIKSIFLSFSLISPLIVKYRVRAKHITESTLDPDNLHRIHEKKKHNNNSREQRRKRKTPSKGTKKCNLNERHTQKSLNCVVHREHICE